MKRGVRNGKSRNGLVAALDLGTTKVACLIGRIGGDGGVQVLGVGHQASKGLKAGTIIDMEEAAAAVRTTVEAAEQMAGEMIRSVIVNISGSSLRSRLIAYEIAIDGHEIGEADLRRILDPTELLRGEASDRAIVHAVPIGYSIDDDKGIRDPRGMCGGRLGVNMHVVTAATSALRNLSACVGHAHLDIETAVAAAFASAQSCLVEDERELGVTVIDMGGGTTDIAVFFDGELIRVDSVAVGGVHVTNDIARGLSTPLHHAERMKTLYGSAITSPSDEREVIRVPLIGEDDGGESNQVPRSMLVSIIRPRIEETFELISEALKNASFDKVAGRRVVLTGGASQLNGVREVAAAVLNKQVRLGRPRALPGLAEAATGPSFATCVGLLNHAQSDSAVSLSGSSRMADPPSGRWGRIGQWIRENF